MSEVKSVRIGSAAHNQENGMASLKPNLDRIPEVDAVPDGWELVTIQEIAEKLIGGGTPSKSVEEYWEGDIPWASVKDLAGITLDDTKDHITEEGLQDSTANLIPAGSIIISTRMTVGEAFINLVDMAINQDLKGILPDRSRTNTYFLAHALRDKNRYLKSLGRGTTVSGITTSDLERTHMALPPLDEQRKIASVLLTVDRAIQTTEAIIAQAKRVKRGLMQDVLVGGITEDGRIRDPEDSLGQFRETALGKVPKSWQMRPLSELCSEIVDSPHSTPTYSEDGVLIVRTSDIREGRFTPDEAKRISEDDYQDRVARLEPQPGDVVFTREAPVGEAFKIPEGTRLCLGQRTMVFRPRPDLLDPDFLVHSIYSSRVRKRFDQLVVGTTNPHLNVGTIRSFKLPVPSLGEQQRIVDLLNSLDDQIDSEKAQKEDLQRLKHGLMQDLLTGRVRTTDTNIDVLGEVQAHG